MDLGQLLGSAGFSAFRDECWNKKPVYIENPASNIAGLYSIATLRSDMVGGEDQKNKSLRILCVRLDEEGNNTGVGAVPPHLVQSPGMESLQVGPVKPGPPEVLTEPGESN